MRPLSSAELLNVWEQGLGQPPTLRALNLLSAACPETPPETLARLSIGQRDSLLLTLREWTFGAQLVSLVNCPQCGEKVELSFNVSDIRVEPPAPVETLALAVGDYEVQFRLPNSLDLALVSDQAGAQQQILERCLVQAEYEGQAVEAAKLPVELVEAIATRMTEADPQAEVQLALACPACRHEWQALFDIVAFFWDELNAWAYRLLREVHVLAAAYGWREEDIVALHPWRRQFYLEMVGG
jgi:hypothetical protein